MGGFISLIIIFIIYAVITIVTVNKNSNLTQRNNKVINPSLVTLKSFKEMVIRSKMLITNWVYLQSNDADKKSLKELHKTGYPQLKDKITNLMDQWSDKSQVSRMDTIFVDFETLLGVQKEIMGKLVNFEDYDDAVIKFMAEESIESKVLPQTQKILDELEKLVSEKDAEATQYNQRILASSQSLRSTSIILAIIFTILGLVGAIALAVSITRPINYIKEIIKKLGRGELPEDQNKTFGNDEIGEMAEAVENLVSGLRSTSYFAESIGNGKYDAEFEPLSENDVLGNALINMRDNLKRVAEEDKKRNWSTEGLAKFGDILRKNNDNIGKLADDIISNLVKYTNSNQGGLFIINEENEDDVHLDLAACYAWDKKKYLEQKIYEGEGLTGQAWLEKETIYMTDVPQDYVMITSGLGEANPNSILIAPLKVNDEVFGVIELASFNTFEDFERDFVEKLAESIASTISSVKINERTSRLLDESRELTEQMRSQEEEMRQNMEELQATQEEMHRAQQDREEKERIINYTNMMIETDEQFHIVSVNEIVKEELKYSVSEINGMALNSLIISKDNFEKAQNMIKQGKPWSGVLKMHNKAGEAVVLQVAAGQIHDPSSGGKKYLFFAADITDSNAL